ncbi:MAG TPA: Ig-like domain-containing protein, partial [Thermodesulfovibrionales bacterium]|nr:Ig-like domain-containing protein [Thermodesulfovibrionales bacterium]
GSYTFTETALNTADQGYSASASAIYEVKLPDITSPTVTIISPLDGSTLPKKGTVAISAKASDESGINRINMYVDNTLLKTCLNMTACQYKWNVNKVSSGTHTIKVQAMDKAPTPNTGSASISVRKQ